MEENVEAEEKVDKKLAKRLAREQLQKQILKDTLAREAALDQLTLNKIKEKWFEAVVDTKVPEMQDNLRHILHYMEKLIEAESHRKALFEDERQEIEEKSTLIAQGHMSALDMLFDIYQKRIRDLHAAYDENLTRRRNEVEAEFQKIEEGERTTQEQLSTMVFIKQLNKEKDEEMMNCDMFLKLDDERSKNTEKQEYLRQKLEKKMERRWGEITSTLSKYDEDTRLRRKDYEKLKAKDDADSRIIYQQMKKTQKLFEQVEEMKSCLEEGCGSKERLSVIADLKQERAKFFKTFKRLKFMLADEVKMDNVNLKNLTVTTNKVTSTKRVETCRGPRRKNSGEATGTGQQGGLRTQPETPEQSANGQRWPSTGKPGFWWEPNAREPIERQGRGPPNLQKILRKGEQILTMYRLCLRLETEYEKVVPVGGSFNVLKLPDTGKNKKAKVEQNEETVMTSQSSGNLFKDYEVLQKFWKKLASVQLSKFALKKCIETMESENKLLKKLLASYLKEVSTKN